MLINVIFYCTICYIAVIHIQPCTYTCGNKINNNDERIHFFIKKYLSHFIRKGCERVVKGLCVRGELETEQTATYWPQVSSVISSTSFLILLSCSTGVLRAQPSAESWFSLPRTATRTSTAWHQLTQFSMAPGYIIVCRPPASCGVAIAPNSTRPRSKWYPDMQQVYVLESIRECHNRPYFSSSA